MLCKTPDRARCVVPNSDDEIGETTQQLIGVEQSNHLFTVWSYKATNQIPSKVKIHQRESWTEEIIVTFDFK